MYRKGWNTNPLPKTTFTYCHYAREYCQTGDAHTPADLGSHYERAGEFLAEHGVTELTVFEGRERRKEPIG